MIEESSDETYEKVSQLADKILKLEPERDKLLEQGMTCIMNEKAEGGIPYLEKAAGLGDPDAALELGRFYLKGDRDPVRALKWLRLAGRAGSTDACWELRTWYASENGSMYSRKKSMDFYILAALQEDGEAAGELCLYYLDRTRGYDDERTFCQMRDKMQRKLRPESVLSFEDRKALDGMLVGDEIPERCALILLAQEEKVLQKCGKMTTDALWGPSDDED